MNNRRILRVVLSILLVFTFNGVFAPVISYGASTLLTTSDWARKDVETAVFYGFIPQELEEVPFDDSITREEFASLIVSVWEKETNLKITPPESNPFVDSESINVLKAFEIDIVNGVGEGKFEPDNTLTREAAATMLTRLYLKLTEENIGTINAQAFKDDNKIHNWAKESVYYMSGKGLLKGVGANEFDPLGLISREQAVVISVRMVKEILSSGLGYIPKTLYKAGGRVYTLANVENAFKYAQYHLLPSITLRMDAALAESLNAQYSSIMTKMEIENLSYSYNPGTQIYTASMKYSLMAEVIALIVNEDLVLSRVSARAQGIQLQLLDIRDSLISPGMNYYQREKAIHDYIVKNYSYDLDNLAGGMKRQESYSLYGLLKNGEGVCQGYSQLFLALCLNTKIPSGIVYGVAGGGPHAWNVVSLYGKFYHVDVTWDDPIPDRGLTVRYDYYNISEQTISKDHQWDNISHSPCDFVTYTQ